MFVVLTLMISVFSNFARTHGLMALRPFLWTSVSLLVGWAGATAIVRKTLGKNSFHRRMLKLMGAMAAQMVGFRVVGLLLHFELAQLVTLEMMGLAATTLIIGTQFLPPVWPVSVLLAGGSLLLTQRPDLLWPVVPVLYQLMGLFLILSWNGAARYLPRANLDR